MVHNPGGDWHPGKGDDPKYITSNRGASIPKIGIMTYYKSFVKIGFSRVVMMDLDGWMD